MSIGDTIQRIHNPSLEVFRDELLTRSRPVILTGALDGQPISAIRTLADALRRWPELKLKISQEYTHNGYESQRGGVPDREMRLGEYVRFVNDDPRTRWLCVEQKLPAEVSSLFTPPPYTRLLAEEGDDVRSFFFFGNPGNHSNFHFDGDFRPALLYQVVGRKRVALIPPDQSTKMLPMKNFSGWLFYNMNAAEQERFLAFTRGCSGVLHPGEALFIPTGWWHHIDYVDFALSFNLRLRRNRMLQLLGNGKVHLNYKSQAIASRLVTPSPEDREVFALLQDALAARTGDALTKFNHIQAVFDRLYKELCPDFPQETLTASLLPTNEAQLWGRELGRGSLYASPSGGCEGARK